MNRKIISFEGIDGSGKTTVIQKVAEKLAAEYKILISREPGGVKIAENIRDLILNEENKDADGLTSLMLFAASRNEHIKKKIEPALLTHDLIILDRFFDSSYAYQGFGQEIGYYKAKMVNELIIKNFIPYRTYLLKISLKTALNRRENENREEANHLDTKTDQFYQRVIEGYDFIASECGKRYKVIDAEQSIDHIVDQVIEDIKKWI